MGELTEGPGEGFNGNRLLSFGRFGKLIDSEGHPHLGVTTTVDDLVVLHSGDQHTDGVVEGPLCLIEDVAATPAQHDTASSIVFAS